MKIQGSALFVSVVVVILAVLTPTEASAQTVCAGSPYLGTSGPELCVNVSEDGGASLDFRGPSPITINQTIGDYRLNVIVSYAVDGAGMGVTIEGTAMRTTAGAGGITVRADGGTNVSVPASSGSLVLIGDVTGPSHVQLGGAAGFRHTSGDILFDSYLVTCDEQLFNAGPFECTHDSIPVDPGAVAAANITAFHITNVGDIIDIPSSAGVGPFNALPSSRRWSKVANLRPSITPLEVRAEDLAPPPDPDLLVLSLWNTGPNQNHIGAHRVPPPYDGSGVTFHDDIDVGPLFGIHRICVPAPGEAVVAYIKWYGGNFDVFVADYDGSSWSTTPVAATSSQNFHTVTCFQTIDGLFLGTFNDSTKTVDILRRDGGGVFQPFSSFGTSDFGGALESPFNGAAIGKAHSFGSFGVDLLDSAAISVGRADGTLALGRLTTTTPPSLAVTNLGSADGEMSVDVDFNLKLGYVWNAEWQDEGVLRGGAGIFYEPPSNFQIYDLGTMTTGTQNPDFQGIYGATGPDGRRYALGDKAREFKAWASPIPTVMEHPDYPFQNLGGPVHIVFPEGSKYGYAVGPGSLILARLTIVEIFSDGFETGNTIAW